VRFFRNAAAFSLKAIPPKLLPLLFVLLYLLLNMIQASLTTLTSDEGYYWYLSTSLDWGYYDHPPLLPFLIGMGRRIFSGELGVRIADVLLVCIGLYFVLELLGDDINRKFYPYLIIISLPLFNYLTFIVFPDTSLVALSAVFLYFYKRFLGKNDYGSGLAMGLVLGLMLYAKYHAVLFIVFVVLSNLSLLRNRKFILAAAVALVLYAPHLWWEYVHDFVSFKYHLFGRSSGFNISSLTEFPSVQTLVLGPALIFVPFIYKTRDAFERALKFIVVGTLVFFCLATFKGYVQFHWTSIVLFPLIILGCSYWGTRKRTVLYWLTVPLLVFTLFLRIYLVYKIIPVNTFNSVDYFHGREQWAQDISGVAHGNPVVFEGQLREAPLYSFYSGMQGIALYPGENKKSEYEIRGVEDSIQGRDVTLVKYCGGKRCTRLVTRMGKEINYLSIKHFASYLDIRIKLKSMRLLPACNAASVWVEIVNHRDTPLAFAHDSYGEPVRLLCVLHREDGRRDSTVILKELSARDSIGAHTKRIFEAEIPLGTPVDAPARGQCTVSFGFDDGEFEQSVNSERYGVLPVAQNPG
jgi:Dolichyl-phosphate-mannose-protein mannosyltransferase